MLARRSANRIAAETGRLIVGTAALMVYIGAAGVLDAERGHEGANITNFGDALWWACTTITTVGYGDRYPVTPVGRLIAIALMFVGIALLGLLTAGIAAWFLRQSSEVAAQNLVEDVVEAVEEAAVIEAAGQRALSDELKELLDAVATLDGKLRDLAQRTS